MQNIAVINQQMIRTHAERSHPLNLAAQRVLERLLGCWRHNLTRPFTHQGRTYRRCVKCGVARDFNLTTWRSHGAFYFLPPSLMSGN